MTLSRVEPWADAAVAVPKDVVTLDFDGVGGGGGDEPTNRRPADSGWSRSHARSSYTW